jgi:hypothetical protein
LLMLILPFAAKLPLGINFWVVFGILLVFGIFSGIVQGTVFTMAGGIPPSYMGMVFFGSGICAIFCNVLRAITLLAFPVDDPAKAERNNFLSAIVFFSVSALIMLLNAVFQIILSKNDFAVYYLDWCKNPQFIRQQQLKKI